MKELSKQDLEKILNNLTKHEDVVVRKAIAEQGYGLDILILDKDTTVRKAVIDKVMQITEDR